MEHLANIALSYGVETVKLGDLYIGGCSIRRHYQNITENLPYYEYFVNTGDGWSSTLDHAIEDTVRSEEWDIISIQHGTADGSWYSDPVYYEHFAALVARVKALAPNAKIAFNMTWVGEPYHSHHEIVAHGGDTPLLYQKIATLTKDLVLPTEGLDVVSPTGTAVQNARTAVDYELTRDGYHLSLGLGRYIAALTFFKALTGADIRAVSWKPDDVSAEQQKLAIAAAEAAIDNPFSVTAMV